MSKFFGNRLAVLRDKAGDDKGAGGGAGDDKNKPDPGADFAALKASNEALMKRLEALEGKKPEPTKDDKEEKSLADKVKEEREAKEKQSGDSKKLEKALTFTLKADDFLKTNAALLPKSIEGIFAQAEKENYATAIEKADAIKVGIITEFFSLQSNLDLLTETQKNNLADFKQLTKDVKQERVQQVYDNVFEPAFQQLKNVKKAEQVNKGLGDPTQSQNAYQKKMMALSQKHFLRETK